MNTNSIRSLAAHGVIGLAVCLGGYAAVVLPLREKLAAARMELAQAKAQGQEARALEGSLTSVMERRARNDQQAAAIARAGAMARSQETLYAAVNARAADFGLRIDEFSPVEPPQSAAGQERAAAYPGDAILRCRFSATGSFGEITQLLRSVGQESGFASIRSIRLSPNSEAGRPLAHAEIETEHYAVDPTPRPAAPGPGEGHP